MEVFDQPLAVRGIDIRYISRDVTAIVCLYPGNGFLLPLC